MGFHVEVHWLCLHYIHLREVHVWLRMQFASYTFMYFTYQSSMYMLYMHMCNIDILGGCEDGKLGEGAAFCGVEVSRLIPACVRIVLSA